MVAGATARSATAGCQGASTTAVQGAPCVGQALLQHVKPFNSSTEHPGVAAAAVDAARPAQAGVAVDKEAAQLDFNDYRCVKMAAYMQCLPLQHQAHKQGKLTTVCVCGVQVHLQHAVDGRAATHVRCAEGVQPPMATQGTPAGGQTSQCDSSTSGAM